MSGYLRHYVDWGLTQIVVISRREKEVGSGYGMELTWETVVARKGTKFVEVVAHERKSFAPGAGGSSVGKDSEREITSDEYRAAATGQATLDTPAVLVELQKSAQAVVDGYAQQAALRAKRAPLYEQLEKLIPKCPACGRKMIKKTGKSGPFWGCPTFPRGCDSIVNMSPEVRRIMIEIDRIA